MTAEEDVARAFASRWLDSSGLGTVPLWRGRIEAQNRPPMPYASFEVRRGREPQFFAPAGPGAAYIDYRTVEVKLYARQPDAERYANEMQAAFSKFVTLATSADCIRVMPEQFPTLKPDPATKKGEDVWIVNLILEVATHRIL